MTRGIELFANEPQISVPILKFMVGLFAIHMSTRSQTIIQCELVQNKNTRLNFGVSSAHGILLFREAR